MEMAFESKENFWSLIWDSGQQFTVRSSTEVAQVAFLSSSLDPSIYFFCCSNKRQPRRPLQFTWIKLTHEPSHICRWLWFEKTKKENQSQRCWRVIHWCLPYFATERSFSVAFMFLRNFSNFKNDVFVNGNMETPEGGLFRWKKWCSFEHYSSASLRFLLLFCLFPWMLPVSHLRVWFNLRQSAHHCVAFVHRIINVVNIFTQLCNFPPDFALHDSGISIASNQITLFFYFFFF